MSRSIDMGQLVDEFCRTADATFALDELLDFLDEKVEGSVNEREAIDLVNSSPYVFESWKDPVAVRYVPRRRFFQGAEFRITPTEEEIEGGYLFPGHRFMPFLCREVFPGDAWLVSPDGSAPRLKRVEISVPTAQRALSFFGPDQAVEYLVSDDPANASKTESVAVSVYDLRDFFREKEFTSGDAILVRTLDWLQGVFSIAKAPATVSKERARKWFVTADAALNQARNELGGKGDRDEQLAIMMLLASEDGRFSLMKNPTCSIEDFIATKGDAEVDWLAKKSGFVEASDWTKDGEFQEFFSLLDEILKKQGLGLGETDVEAYMRDALYQGQDNPLVVLDRICAGRSLVFKSVEAQNEFHELWDELWRDTVRSQKKGDPHGPDRARLLAAHDECLVCLRELEARKVDPKTLAADADFQELRNGMTSLSGLLGLFNLSDVAGDGISDDVKKVIAVLLDELPRTIAKLKGR